MTASAAPALLADIGGTNARFTLRMPDGTDRDERTLACADYPGPTEAAQAYLAMIKPPVAPDRGAFCVACPVLGDDIALTNNPWRFSIEAVRKALHLTRLEMVNDFVANALACPALKPEHLVQIGGGAARAGFPIAALGPGTGLGVALMVPTPGGGWVPVGGEGGHVTLAAQTPREAAVIEAVGRQFDHVSAERLGNGAGLSLLYATLCALDGRKTRDLEPAEVTSAALSAQDGHAVEALTIFCAFLGATAGNLALTAGSMGGVYILGGIAPRILEFLKTSPFRARFEAKGRFRAYLEAVPTLVVTAAYPAFIGLGTLIDKP